MAQATMTLPEKVIDYIGYTDAAMENNVTDHSWSAHTTPGPRTASVAATPR